MKQTLLLNNGYQPIKIISWKRAIRLFFLDKVEILSEYDWKIHTVNSQFPAPAVVRLIKQVRSAYSFKVKFTRANVYARDDKMCQYCGKKFVRKELTLDHVIPKSLGGTTAWSNIVTCCQSCNIKKSSRTPQQANMRLINKPSYPGKFVTQHGVPKEWKDWIF